nr:uncharacterized protein CTRU02_04327 [Colletotrichum truncatum]KAF6795517.1 hypothetical protein CTRU02_04327 [Colletotrichum truncatum]
MAADISTPRPHTAPETSSTESFFDLGHDDPLRINPVVLFVCNPDPYESSSDEETLKDPHDESPAGIVETVDEQPKTLVKVVETVSIRPLLIGQKTPSCPTTPNGTEKFGIHAEELPPTPRAPSTRHLGRFETTSFHYRVSPVATTSQLPELPLPICRQQIHAYIANLEEQQMTPPRPPLRRKPGRPSLL